MITSNNRSEFISLFSGAGGLDLGLERAGWHCLYAADSDSDAVRTLRENQSPGFASSAILEQADVRDLTGAEILGRIGRRKGEVPLMAGGPPCQSWSSAGKQKGFDDPRGVLFRDFVRLADECGCRMIVFENVRGMLTARGPSGEPGEALAIIRQTLSEHGFRSEVSLLNAADYGVPQRRVRLIIVGFRDVAAPDFPDPTHEKGESNTLGLLPPWRTLGDLLETLEPPDPNELIRPRGTMAERLRGLKPGQGAKSAGKKETTRPGGHWGYLQGGFVADPALPARTVTASSQQDWIMLPDHTHRRLCPRECAAIQTFPENWVFAGNIASQYRQIGNAVPPSLAEHVGKSLLKMLDGLPASGPIRLELPRHLEAAIRYTKKEHLRNGESRKRAELAPASA
jgi:DNA (cytosine-5)-methyltransferase 1